jgi:hypothetical protein
VACELGSKRVLFPGNFSFWSPNVKEGDNIP